MVLAPAVGRPAELGGVYDGVYDGCCQWLTVGVCCNYFVNAVQQGYRPVTYRVRQVPFLKKQDTVGFEPFLGQRLGEVVVTYPSNDLLDRGGGDVQSVVVCEVPPPRLVGL